MSTTGRWHRADPLAEGPARPIRKAARLLLAVAASGTLGPPPDGRAQVPTADLTAGLFRFQARATLGDFIGWTTAARGQMTGAADLSGVRGWVEVDAARLTTENGLRDRHMRAHLAVDRYPAFRLDLAGVHPDSAAGDTSFVTLSARLTIHGVAHDVTLPARVAPDTAGVRLWSSFPLDIRDYGMRAPSRFLGLAKMDPLVNVSVQVAFGKPSPPPLQPAQP